MGNKEVDGFLVLRRDVGDSIMIGEDIEICVNRKQAGHIWLAIKAPPEFLILRKELLDDNRKTGNRLRDNRKSGNRI